MKSRRDEIPTLPEMQGASWPSSSQPCPPGEGCTAALPRGEVLPDPRARGSVTSQRPSLGLPQTPPQEGECRVWLHGAGCRSLCSFSSASLPPSLPPYGTAAPLHFDTAWLQKCRARSSLF